MALGTIILIVSVLLVGGIGVFALVRFGLKNSSGGGDVQLRLEEYGGRSEITTPQTLEELEMSRPFSQRVVRPMLLKLAQAFSKLSSH